MTMPEQLQAARLLLAKQRPYLASAAWALHPLPRPGLETLGVDKYWRLYYDPAVLEQWSAEGIAAILYHEICHLLRDHATRMQDFDPVYSNMATDAEINDDLIREGIRFPVPPLTPQFLGQPEDLLAEEYYHALVKRKQQKQDQPNKDESQPGDTDSEASETQANSRIGGSEPQAGSEEGDKHALSPAQNRDGSQALRPKSEVPGDAQQTGPQPVSELDWESGCELGPPGAGSFPETDGGGAGQSPPGGNLDTEGSRRPSSDSNASRVGEGNKGAVRVGLGDGGVMDSGGGVNSDQYRVPAPAAGRCGSCATGQMEPWEDPPPVGGSAGIGAAEAELLRREVARQVNEHVCGRGHVPGHWMRWAEAQLHTQVNWRRQLAAAIRHAAADAGGAADYSYRRPSRRQGQVGRGDIIYPALRCPVPTVAIVADTSASVSDRMLAQALTEITAILRLVGHRGGVHVLAVDQTVQTCRQVFRPEQIQLAGGGGTDMGAGLKALVQLSPRPQLGIVITDGHTVWPQLPPRGIKIIVVLSGDGQAPDWARVIKISA